MFRRGVSPIFSSIIIIAVTILGAAASFYFADQIIHFLAPSNVIAVENAAISKGTSGLADFVCTVKNVGRNSIVRVSVQLAGEPEIDFPNISPSRPLHPGQSASIIISLNPENYLVGNTYAAKIKAVSSDGSTLAYAMSVPCKGVGGSQIWNPPQGGQHSEQGQQPPEQGQEQGQRASELVLLRDGFDDGSLSGWRLWGDADGYQIDVVNHGRPAPCLYVGGNGPRGARVGAAKTVDVPENLENMTITFNYNVFALKDGGVFPGNLWLRIEADGEAVYDEQIYEAKSAGSGWKREEAVITLAKAPRNITVIFYMVDESDKEQMFWLDNIELKIVIPS